MFAKAQPGCCGVAARLPKKPGTQKLMPFSSARAQWEENNMANVRTLAERQTLRRCAGIERSPLAAASAILAVTLWLQKMVAFH